ncbi:sialate O-acetylesterase [Fibrella forsythiae]|uniref:T9SS type A sorting domain-containing protein n=1 Tax=Fibrella forsythiae TaxID=2817061 RepID=A0ABS3JIW9_9BACT|nr:sialate O-acetylesterase [Fibrella forsythiae]MBO0949954.1 T9SS type A sorting domain-containing protein [Fibrella forsythiae]
MAQVQVSFPVSRAVLQRNTANNASVTITGTYSTAVTRVEARVEARNGQGTTTDWQTISSNPQGGVFNGAITVQGGWYNLSVRLMRDNQEVGTQTIERVGVGEVFVIAGQSNSGQIDDNNRRDGESAQDDRVNCVNYRYVPTQYPNDAPIPAFSHLDGPNDIAPRGVGSWCWGRLGDLLAARLNVPVLFFSAAYTGTSVRNWAETAKGERTLSDYEPRFYELKHPYFPLKLALQNYTHMLGVRAVLWHQGEADNQFETTTSQYAERLRTVIDQSRADFGKNVPWVVARASYSDFYSTDQKVIDGQNQVIASSPNTFAGPNTDGIQIPRSRAPLFDVVHFDNPGLREVAAAWDASLNSNFFNNAVPISPAAAPILTVSCAGNNAVTYSVTNYQQVFWESGETGQSITKPAGSTLRAKVKDALGNVYYTPSITIAAAPTIQADGPTRFCVTGSVNLTSSTDQNFVWNNGQSSKTINVTSSGTYSVSIKDASGCTFTSNAITVSINPLPARPTITTEGSLTSCLGDNTTLSAGPAASYKWSNGETTQRITVSQTGSYSLIVADENGCQSPASAIVNATVNPRPDPLSINFSGPTTFCATGSLALNASSAPVYEWSNGQTTPTISVNQSGNYTVRTRNSFNCPSAPSNVVAVTVNPLPVTPIVSSDRATTFCQGDNTVLTVTNTSASGYNWNNGSRTPQLTVTQSGSYSLTISDGNGCVSAPSNVVNILVNPVPATPQVTASGRTIFCANESVTLTSSPEANYEWNSGQSSQSITVAQSGSYSIRTRNQFNCFSERSGPINVTVNPLPAQPTITNERSTTFCQGDNTVLVASPAVAYNWSNGNQSQRLTISQSGNFSLTVSDANGCVSVPSAIVSVVVNPLPETPRLTASSSTTFCANESVTLSSTAEASYIWSTGQTTRSIGVNQSGSYSLRTRNQFNCESAQSNVAVVLVNPLPAAPIVTARGSLTFCEGTNVTLVTNSTLRTLWSTGDSTQNLVVLQAGIFTARVRDANGCVSPNSLPVATNTRPRPQAPQIAQIGTYLLQASGAPANERYYWRRDTDSLAVATSQLRVAQTGVYSVRTAITYSPALVCLSAPSANYTYQLPTDNQNISLYPNPNPDGIFFIETLVDLSNTVITVYTLSGQQVYRTTPTVLDGRKQLSLSVLAPGQYLIMVQSGDIKVTKRVQIGQ